MSNLLGIDTSTEACTVALRYNDQTWQQTVPQKQHADRLLGMIDDLFAQVGIGLHQLDAIVWGKGPGMFTGLRIGAGVVQGLAYASDLPVIPVSSLAVLAQTEPADKTLAAMDARMGQVYWCAFARNGKGELVPINEERVEDPRMVALDDPGPFTGVGPGWDVYHEHLVQALGPKLADWKPGRVPDGGALLSLGEQALQRGETVTASDAIPTYVRDDVAVKQVPTT